jgi:hypothetical protein
MSDDFWNAGYDAGAVVDMNNLAIGYFPRTQISPMAIPLGQVQAGSAQVPQTAPGIPAAESETKS